MLSWACRTRINSYIEQDFKARAKVRNIAQLNAYIELDFKARAIAMDIKLY